MVMTKLFGAAWRYRHFVVSSIKNDLRSRFARSKLGATWMILQPLAMVVIYSVILSRIMTSKLPGINSGYAYPIYLLSGILAWSLFAEIITRSLTVFVDNGNLLKKIVFPRVCLPLITLGSALVNNILLFIVTIVVFVILGHYPTEQLWWIPVLIGITACFALGIGLILGVFNVFVRDVAQVMTVVLQVLFWLTPIVYTPSIVPPRFHAVLKFNPINWIVSGFQDVLAYGRPPGLHATLAIAVLSVLFLAFAMFMFRRASRDMVDVL